MANLYDSFRSPRIWLLVAAFYFIFSLLLLPAINLVFSDTDYYYNAEQQTPTTRTRRSSRETILPLLSGLDIVQEAYNQTYRVMEDACQHHYSEMCLNQTFYNTSHQVVVPWWFKTLMRDGANMRTGLFGGWHLLSSQKRKMTMCVMEKVATKQWRKVFCDLDPQSNAIMCHGTRGAYPKSTLAYRKVVFTRDPLERFLSAFIDKCIHRIREDHCHVFTDGKLSTGLKQNPKLMFETFVDTMPLKWNVHFAPMGLLCNGLYKDFDKYHFVGHMGPRFYNDVETLGKQFHIQKYVDHVFDLQNHLNTTNEGKETSASKYVEDYYTPETVKKVLQYTSLDYVSLKLPIPEWAEQMLLRDDDSRITAER